MKRILTLFCALLVTASVGWAQTLNVSGQILCNGQPLTGGGYMVELDASTTFGSRYDSTFTDSLGFFSFQTTLQPGATQGAALVFIRYNGRFYADTLFFSPGTMTFTQVNIDVCQGSCQAGFSYLVSGATVNFTSQPQTAPGDSVQSITWNFGGQGTSTQWHPSFTFNSSGTYLVTQTIQTVSGCVSSTSKMIFVTGTQNCNADFQYAIGANGAVQFYDSSATSSGPPVSYSWSFGDGNTATTANPNHTYAASGNYTVCLVITDGQGCVDSTCKTIFVNAGSTNCSADFGVSPSATDPLRVRITGQSTGLGPGATNSYSYQIGAGNRINFKDFDYGFNAPGTYTICLYFTSTLQGVSCSDSICKTVTVTAPPTNCNATFNYVYNQNDSSEIIFLGNSQVSPGTTYSWDYGDGNSGTGRVNRHQYTSSGTYLVCLYTELRDSVGTLLCADSSCQNVVISTTPTPVSCDANFRFVFTPGDSAELYFFRNAAAAPGETLSWDFGDGNTGSGANAQHKYASPGTYQVCLYTEIRDSIGTLICADSSCQSVTITAQAKAQLSGNIYGGNSFYDTADVYLIRLDSTVAGGLAVADSMTTWRGLYFFTVPAGTYYIAAAPHPGSSGAGTYAPTYHDSALVWNQAVAVVTNGIVNTTADVHLRSASNRMAGNPGTIQGLLLQGANKDEGDPISGVLILLFDENDQLVAFTRTDATGAYSFGELAYGTYRVHVEILGRDYEDQMVVLSAASSMASDVNFELVTDGIFVTTSLDRGFAAGTVVGLYPNPTSGEVQLRLQLDRALRGELRVLDLRGRSIQRQKIELGQGPQQVRVSLDKLPAGAYLLQLQGEAGRWMGRVLKQ